ncbi:MAG: Rrf2 family transcriptional regulator [Bacteroidetes bacterium]|nr:Rrf2 family transcriptional regulator [Bacteroidota bacterium]
MLSNACKYAIRALIYLATRMNDGLKVSIRELSSEIDSPEPFTAKIMQSLSKQDIVSSVKGPNGGFYIDENQANVRLIEIVKAIDGMQVLTGCGLGLKTCSAAHPCPIHAEFSAMRDGFSHLLYENTIRELADELMAGHSAVKNW